MGVSVVLEEVRKNVGSGDVGESINHEGKDNDSKGVAYEGIDINGETHQEAKDRENDVEEIVIKEVAEPVSSNVHARDYLLVFRLVLPLLHDEGDDGGELEPQGDREDERPKQPRNRVVNLELVERACKRRFSQSNRDVGPLDLIYIRLCGQGLQVERGRGDSSVDYRCELIHILPAYHRGVVEVYPAHQEVHPFLFFSQKVGIEGGRVARTSVLCDPQL